MRQLAAGPALTQAWAAGLPYWAASVLVTAHVSGVGQGSPVGRHLLQSSHHLVPPLTLPLSHASVALRAAVLVVQAADGLAGRGRKGGLGNYYVGWNIEPCLSPLCLSCSQFLRLGTKSDRTVVPLWARHRAEEQGNRSLTTCPYQDTVPRRYPTTYAPLG